MSSKPHIECLFCNHLNPSGASYCNNCGSPLHLQPCARCGAIDKRDAKACYKCGEEFSRAAPEIVVQPGSDVIPAEPVTPEWDFKRAPTLLVDRRAPSPQTDVDIIGERTPLTGSAALNLSEFSTGFRSDSKEPLVREVEAATPETVFQNDDPALVSGGLQRSDEPVSPGRSEAIPDQHPQNASRLRLGVIAATLILLTIAATVFLLRSPSPTITPVADQTSNLPTPPKPDPVKQPPAEPESVTPTTSPTPPPVADLKSNLPTPLEPDLATQQPAEPKSAVATTPTDSAVAPKTRRDPPPSVKAVPAKSWKDALNADLKACREEFVFSRIVCIEKARWKHCPGHWGTIGDCPSNMAGQKGP